MKLQVSRSMQQLITSMQTHGNTVERFPGGFWRCEAGGGYSFGTSTVEALIRRGIAEYTSWQSGRKGSFPIKATLLPQFQSLPKTESEAIASWNRRADSAEEKP